MKITEEQMIQCIAEYKSGDSLESLAQRYEVTRVTITRYLSERMKIRKPGAQKGKPRSKKDLGPEWDLLGKIPDAELAEKIGCTRQNVSKVRQTRGIPSSRDLEIYQRMTASDTTHRGKK